MPIPSFLRVQSGDVLLSAKVQPRASKNEISEPLGAELRIRVTAPPVDAKANEATLELLAERLRCSRSRVELVRGQTSRHKVFKLHGFTPEQVMAALGGHGETTTDTR